VVGSLNDGRLERGLRQEAAETKASDEGRLERGLRQEAAETKASDKGRLERGLRQEAAETKASDEGRLERGPKRKAVGLGILLQTKGSNYKLVNYVHCRVLSFSRKLFCIGKRSCYGAFWI
jgi:hypothetical protein